MGRDEVLGFLYGFLMLKNSKEFHFQIYVEVGVCGYNCFVSSLWNCPGL